MTESIKIIKLDPDPATAGVRAATIFVHYEDGEATIILRPTAALPHATRNPRGTATVGECVEYRADNGIIAAQRVRDC